MEARIKLLSSQSKDIKEHFKSTFGAFKYDYIMPFFQNYTIAVLNGKAGLIDTITGKIISDFIYDDLSQNEDLEYDYLLDDIIHINLDIWDCEKKYCLIRLNNKWGMLSSKGKTIIDFNFDSGFQIYNNRYIITQKNNKWGVVDKKLNILIEFKYDKLFYAGDNVFEACTGDKWGIININNEILADFLYDNLSIYKNLAIVKKDLKYGIIDFKGSIIQDFKYDTLLYGWWASKKHAVFLKDKTIYYINTNGEIDFSSDFNRFDNITYYPLEHRFYCIENNKKFGIADIKGNIVLEPKHESVSVFGNNFIVDKNTIINKKGKIIKKMKFDYISPSNNNYSIVYSNDKAGVIDNDGKTLIECQYDSLLPSICKNILVATKNTQQGVIDLNNNIILDFIYDNIMVCCCENKKNVRFVVKINQKYALLDEKGNRLV